jgi:mono/diheme cytochrome c family protein
MAVLLLAASGCEQYPQGAELYRAYCSNCHQPDGSGLGLLIPDLRASTTLRDHSEYVACMIKHGSSEDSPLANYSAPMPSFKNLTDTEISNIMNYMNNNWDNAWPMVSPNSVRDYLQKCSSDVR